MDPNLEKIRDANIKAIYHGRLAEPIIHAKSYLYYILGEEREKQINEEIDKYVVHLKTLIRGKNNGVKR